MVSKLDLIVSNLDFNGKLKLTAENKKTVIKKVVKSQSQKQSYQQGRVEVDPDRQDKGVVWVVLQCFDVNRISNGAGASDVIKVE